jgi:protease-4
MTDPDNQMQDDASQAGSDKAPPESTPWRIAAQKTRKSRARWRILAFVAMGIAVLAIIGRFALPGQEGVGDHIARVRIDGVITTDPVRLHVLESLAEDDDVKAVVVAINSPGGSTAGGEELYEALLALSEEKPVVAVIHELGASAAYMTAIASDRIFARRLSIVGSIGVLYQHINAGKLLDTIGLDFDKVQTGPLKAEPDIDDPLAGPARESLQTLVNDSFEWFVDVVAERRGMDRATVLELADGRIVTGRMGLEAGLIDAIGSEKEAQAWLEDEKGIEPDLKILTHFPPPVGDVERILRFLGAEALSATGLTANNSIPLDGLVSLWQAGATP